MTDYTMHMSYFTRYKRTLRVRSMSAYKHYCALYEKHEAFFSVSLHKKGEYMFIRTT